MPVDRANRDKMGKTIVAYMRREIKTRQFEHRTLARTRDKGAAAAGWQLWLIYDDYINHPVRVSPEGWDHLRRWLAFLRTDYGVVERRPPAAPRPRRLAAVSLLILGVVLVLGLFSVPWLYFFATWAALGIPWTILAWLKWNEDEHLAKSDPDLTLLWRSEPFLSEADWLAHAHLLDDLDLPAFDPAVHGVPPPKPETRPLDRAFWWLAETRVVRGVLYGLGGLLMLVLCELLLPLLLVLALCRRRGERDHSAYLRTEGKQD